MPSGEVEASIKSESNGGHKLLIAINLIGQKCCLYNRAAVATHLASAVIAEYYREAKAPNISKQACKHGQTGNLPFR